VATLLPLTYHGVTTSIAVMDTPIRRLRMEDQLWHAAERVAQEQDRSASWIIRKALEEYIERYRAAKRAAKQDPQATQREPGK
jgi:hypothetical protein